MMKQAEQVRAAVERGLAGDQAEWRRVVMHVSGRSTDGASFDWMAQLITVASGLARRILGDHKDDISQMAVNDFVRKVRSNALPADIDRPIAYLIATLKNLDASEWRKSTKRSAHLERYAQHAATSADGSRAESAVDAASIREAESSLAGYLRSAAAIRTCCSFFESIVAIQYHPLRRSDYKPPLDAISDKVLFRDFVTKSLWEKKERSKRSVATAYKLPGLKKVASKRRIMLALLASVQTSRRDAATLVDRLHACLVTFNTVNSNVLYQGDWSGSLRSKGRPALKVAIETCWAMQDRACLRTPHRNRHRSLPHPRPAVDSEGIALLKEDHTATALLPVPDTGWIQHTLVAWLASQAASEASVPVTSVGLNHD